MRQRERHVQRLRGLENPCMFCRRGEWVWAVCLSLCSRRTGVGGRGQRRGHRKGPSLQPFSAQPGLSRCGAQAPDAQAQRPWLTGPAALRTWDPPGPGHEPVSPALAGGLSTTVPPGKPYLCSFDDSCSDRCEVISHCGFDLHSSDD